jgi:hypothetical protein
MLETARGWLAELRAGADPRRFSYRADDDPADERAQLLLALQYDQREADAPLLRLLLDAEREAHEDADFQGLHDSLKLAAWLVARLRDPADVFRMWAAKCANFDTHCGFDGQHLVASGVASTLAYLRESDDPRRDDILEYLTDESGECQFTDDELAHWHAAMAEWFPANEADESPLTMLERALEFAPEHAPRWLERWLAGEPRNERTLADLCHYALRLGDFDLAVATAEELLELATDRHAALERLARVLTSAGRLAEAEGALLRCAAEAPARPRSAWEQRTSLERWLDLAEAVVVVATDEASAADLAEAVVAVATDAADAADLAIGRRALARADALLTAGFGHCLDNLRRLTDCAAALGETEIHARVAAARDEESRKCDAFMARVTAK